MNKIFILILFVNAFVFTAKAQLFDRLSNPTITINLSHPPGLGLKVNKIAFGPATGTCADQIIDAIKGDFVNNQIEVIDRENLTTILAEHQFTLSGYVDQSSAAAIGKILGPSALIFVKVQRCDAQTDNLMSKKTVYYKGGTTGTVPLYIARTRAFLQGSIQAIDLATGRNFGSKPFTYSPEATSESTEGQPDPPAKFDVQNTATRMMVTEVHRMFLPWNEAKTLYYYDDKEHDLKAAYQAMKVGNLDMAFDVSKKNLEACKSDTKIKDRTLAHAYYNMGMSFMLREEHDKALECFQETAKLHPGDIVTSAINECNIAKRLKSSRQQVDEKASMEADKKMAEEAKTVQVEKANTLSNKDIIELSQKKLPNSLIIQKIKNSKCKFDTSTDGLVALSNAKVAEAVIMVMMEKQ
jgi:hypothetical protein